MVGEKLEIQRLLMLLAAYVTLKCTMCNEIDQYNLL